jgi:hypothetical protein
MLKIIHKVIGDITCVIDILLCDTYFCVFFCVGVLCEYYVSIFFLIQKFKYECQSKINSRSLIS